jgi:uncharacterized protein HemX
MADPLKPDVSPIVDGGKAVATGAAKAAAGGVAKVAAWHTISLATAAALGLGGGGYYLHRDTKARTQLTEMEQQAGALEDRAKKADLAKEALQAQLEQSKEEMRKLSASSLELEQAKSELAKLKDVSA